MGLFVYWRLVTEPPRSGQAGGQRGTGRPARGRTWYWWFLSTAVAAVFGLALIALREFDQAASRQAWLMPLRACGRRCYSIYLIHLPVCTVGNELLYSLGLVGFWARVLVMTPLVSVAAVGAGWVFFATVESKFLNPPSNRKPHVRPVAGEREVSSVGEAVRG